jgi:hypothetical protein
VSCGRCPDSPFLALIGRASLFTFAPTATFWPGSVRDARLCRCVGGASWSGDEVLPRFRDEGIQAVQPWFMKPTCGSGHAGADGVPHRGVCQGSRLGPRRAVPDADRVVRRAAGEAPAVGLKATPETSPVCPRRVRASWPLWTSQTVIVLSWEALARRWPSGLRPGQLARLRWLSDCERGREGHFGGEFQGLPHQWRIGQVALPFGAQPRRRGVRLVRCQLPGPRRRPPDAMRTRLLGRGDFRAPGDSSGSSRSHLSRSDQVPAYSISSSRQRRADA